MGSPSSWPCSSQNPASAHKAASRLLIVFLSVAILFFAASICRFASCINFHLINTFLVVLFGIYILNSLSVNRSVQCYFSFAFRITALMRHCVQGSTVQPSHSDSICRLPRQSFNKFNISGDGEGDWDELESFKNFVIIRLSSAPSDSRHITALRRNATKL